jgi:type I restriction enzyme S subunit
LISRNLFTNIYPLKPLGELVEFLDNKRRPVKESERKIGNYPYFGANGQQGTIDDYIFDEPLVLLAEDGGHFNNPDRGIAYRISGKTWVNNHAHVLRPKKDIDITFLYRVLENYDVTPFVTGTTRGKLTKSGASEIIIPLPPLEEQKRIAEILDQAEELRRKRREAIAQLDTLTQSIFIEMFGDPVANVKKWNITKVGEVADVQGGLQVSSAARKKYPREVPYLRVANVYRGYLDLSEIKMLRATDTEIHRTLLKKNDLLIVEGHGNPNEIGRVALWDGSINDCIHQNHIIRARFEINKIIPLYACHYLNSPGGRQHLLKSGKTTSGLNTISVSEVRASPVLLPPLSLQKEFAHRVEAVEELKKSHRASLSELDALFASLQHRAFRGEL